MVLQQIRTKAFMPDSTRSGMMEAFSLSVEQQAKPLNKGIRTSLLLTRNPAPMVVIPIASQGQGGPVVAPRILDFDVTMYRNIQAKLYTIVAVGGASSFSCGICISADYEQIEASVTKACLPSFAPMSIQRTFGQPHRVLWSCTHKCALVFLGYS